MYRNCQVCGNPIFSAVAFGTDSDGRLNRDYCSNCYRGGHFYSKDRPVDDFGVNPLVGIFAAHTGSGAGGNFGNVIR